MKPTKTLNYEEEYLKMKKNNKSLAKALAEQQQLNKSYRDENNLLQKKQYMSSTQILQYEKTLNDLLKSLKQSLTSCVDLTNIISSTVILCNQGTSIQRSLHNDSDKNSLYKKLNLRSPSPGSPNKTHAVKPMVSGHIIHHPTINLSRLTETRVTGLLSVQNHNNSTYNTENNHENGESFENETDESLEDSSLVLENDNSLQETNHINRGLEPLLELSDEDVSPNNSILKEVRVVIEPLTLDNIFNFDFKKTVKFANQEKLKIKKVQDDPLEGTSSMLDDCGNVMKYNNHISKPRLAAKRVNVGYESDSEESTVGSERKIKSLNCHSDSWVSKQKAPIEKKDVTGQKYKIKRNKFNENNSSDENVEQSADEHNTNNFEESKNFVERRCRRLAPKSLAEPSLKRKLRR